MVKKIFIVILCLLMCFGFALFPMAASQKTCHVPSFSIGGTYSLSDVGFISDAFNCTFTFPLFNKTGVKTVFSSTPQYFNASKWSNLVVNGLTTNLMGFMGFKMSQKDTLLSGNKYLGISFTVKHSMNNDNYTLYPFYCTLNNIGDLPMGDNWYKCFGSQSFVPTKEGTTNMIVFDLNELSSISETNIFFGWGVVRSSYTGSIDINSVLEYENIQFHLSEKIPKIPGDIRNVAGNLKDVSGWLWSKFTALIKMIGDNDLLLWSVSFAIVSGTVYLAIKVVRKFGIKGRR